jgi:hypothetical protein
MLLYPFRAISENNLKRFQPKFVRKFMAPVSENWLPPPL